MKKTLVVTLIFLYSCIIAVNLTYSYTTNHVYGTTVYKKGQTEDGYTLYRAKFADTRQKIYLIDMDGHIVHTWTHSERPLAYAEPLPNGHIIGMYGAKFIVELDWDSNLIWEYEIGPDDYLHHDFEKLDNGNVLILAHRERNVPAISSKPIIDDSIYEVNFAGQIVWQWHTYEHFEDFGYSDIAKEMIAEEGDDWAHTNSISVLPDNPHWDPRFKKGNILVSQRNTNTMYIIDKDSGQIVWQMGPINFRTIGQHDAKMITQDLPGAGNILVFDNGGGAGYPKEFRDHSRILEINPKTRQIEWGYTAVKSKQNRWTFYSGGISSVQRLPNGNTFVCEGATGRFFEVTPDHKIVWEYVNWIFENVEDLYYHEPVLSNLVYRAWRVPLDWPPR
jgi:hypothetical protein